jgi:hypothetical protein
MALPGFCMCIAVHGYSSGHAKRMQQHSCDISRCSSNNSTDSSDGSNVA